MKDLSDIKGILFDLDGVLYVGSQPIAGALDAVERIRSSGLVCRFVTNTSTLSLVSLSQKLTELGFTIPETEIISAPQAAILFLRTQHNPVCRLLLADDVKRDFSEFRQSDHAADYIVIGDIGKAWSYDLMNEVFNRLIDGARLIAIHKNRFWQTESGLQMDIGGFVTALEYASSSSAMIIGKPAPEFFEAALLDMKLLPHEVAMIGDDIDADVDGAQRCGLKGILVKTGKYREAYVAASPIKPNLVIDSIRELPSMLE